MPIGQEVHIDSALSAFSVGVVEEPGRVFGSFFPVTPVDHKSDKYHVIDRNPFLRGDSQPLIPGKESAGHVFTLSQDNFNAINYADHADVYDDDLRNADNPQMIEEGATRLATTNLMLTHEQRFAATYFKTGVWGTDLTPAVKWSDKASSDPLGDIDQAIETLLLTGGRPDGVQLKLLMGYQVWKALKNHPTIIERIRAGGTPQNPAMVSRQAVAALLEVDEIVVASSVQATNPVGTAESYGFIFGKHALLAFVGRNGTGDFMASAGRLFAWKGTNGGAIDPMGKTIAVQVFDTAMRPRHLVRYEAQMAVDFKITGAKLGYFFNAAVL